MSTLRVIGIGSPFGDDQVGWRVVQALAEGDSTRGGIQDCPYQIACLDRPGPGLLGELADGGDVIIVDALLDDGPAGRVLDLTPAELCERRTALSGHELGVASSLDLLAALGETLPVLHLVAVTIADVGSGFEMSPPVAAAVPRAAARVAEVIRTL